MAVRSGIESKRRQIPLQSIDEKNVTELQSVNRKMLQTIDAKNVTVLRSINRKMLQCYSQ